MKLFQTTLHAPGFPTSNAVLTGYLSQNYEAIDPQRLHPAVLVIPGGGYNHVSQREGEPVALQFLAAGIQTFTLEYSVAPAAYPQALCEALEAIRYIRTHAEEFFICPDNLTVCGFSAGGHLALTTAACWNQPHIQNLLGEPGRILRPDKLVLSYPVVSSGSYGHQGSFDCLTGNRTDKEDLLSSLSMEHQITEDFPPVYLWHTFTDETVPVQNSLLLAMALAEKRVPLEMHIYPEGEHGLSLGTYMANSHIPYGNNHPCSSWIRSAVDFIYK